MQGTNNIRRLSNFLNINSELLSLCAEGNRKAQKQLYEKCFGYLMPLCFRYHKNEVDARAAFNMGFLKIIKSLEKLDLEEVVFAAWSKRIMTNVLIDDYRKNKNHKEKISVRDNERELEFHSTTGQNDAESNFGEANIMRLLDKLKPATKQVFMLYVIDGYNHREIGEMLEMSEGTSKWHLSTARKDLRELLEIQNERGNRSRLVI